MLGFLLVFFCSRFGLAQAGAPLEPGPDQIVQVTVEHLVGVVAHQAGAVVFDVLLVENVAADLAAPLNRFLLAAQLGHLLLALLPLALKEAATQHLHGQLLVLVLAAGGLASDHDARGQVDYPHRAVGGVDPLTAVALGAEDVYPQIFGLYFDLHAVVHLGADLDRGEAGVAAASGVEGAGAYQPVNAALGREQAVGVFAANDQFGRVDAGLGARGHVDQLHLEAVTFGPAGVHPQQHLGPVHRLGAAGAGLDRQDGVLLGVFEA